MSSAILVVDDSASIRALLAKALAPLGYPVLLAADAEQAITHYQQAAVALTVSDINMPGSSGLDLLAQVKAHPCWRQSPFVLLTTEGRPDLIQQAQRYGAAAWVMKPFDSAVLVDIVRRLLAPQAVAS